MGLGAVSVESGVVSGGGAVCVYVCGCLCGDMLCSDHTLAVISDVFNL